MKIYTKDLSREFISIIDKYNLGINDCVEKAVIECAEKAVEELRSTSPKGKGTYARSWTYTKNAGRNYGLFGVKVHNGKHYRLTHLLENGHDLINKDGKRYGRAKAIPHIKPVEEKTISRFEDEVVRRINDIN